MARQRSRLLSHDRGGHRCTRGASRTKRFGEAVVGRSPSGMPKGGLCPRRRVRDFPGVCIAQDGKGVLEGACPGRFLFGFGAVRLRERISVVAPVGCEREAAVGRIRSQGGGLGGGFLVRACRRLVPTGSRGSSVFGIAPSRLVEACKARPAGAAWGRQSRLGACAARLGGKMVEAAASPLAECGGNLGGARSRRGDKAVSTLNGGPAEVRAREASEDLAGTADWPSARRLRHRLINIIFLPRSRAGGELGCTRRR